MLVPQLVVKRRIEAEEDKADHNVIKFPPIEPVHTTPSKTSNIDATLIKTTTSLAKPLQAQHPPPPPVPAIKHSLKEPARKHFPLETGTKDIRKC